MNDPDLIARFQELDAARAFGDLSPEEHDEWAQLVEQHGFTPDADLDLLVAGLDASLIDPVEEPRPELVRRLEASTTKFMPLAAETPRPAKADVIPLWRNPALGWAAAACLALVLLVSPEDSDPAVSVDDQRQTLIATDVDAVQLPFTATAQFANLEGDVIWTDDGQTGFVRLSGLPANDPTKAQYQLWIVDPDRDERPVDGGVFDIPAGSDEVVVPIRAALRVDDPVAFVITVEQPGGVVVSKQEIVAAIAARG
jgi:anti-sigma-K factor RskA